jgi:DNA modification methylase
LEFDRLNQNKLHPTQKPVEMLEKLLIDGSRENNIIYDCFLGSGSTLIACEKLNRICYGFELNPIYCDVIIKRWEDFTGKKAKKIC